MNITTTRRGNPLRDSGPMRERQAWVLTGPTGVGKTAIAHQLAKQFNAVALCADSMAIYRHMDIGTAKPEPALQIEVPYCGINLVDPNEAFSVGAFVHAARRAVEEAEALGRPLLVVGGTGLYISALLRGLDVQSEPDPLRRAHWERVWEEGGLQGLQDALRKLDESAFQRLADPQNPRRVIRALERAEAGETSASWSERHLRPVVGLRMEPAPLRERIEARARAMFEEGLVEEARGIRARWPELSPTARHAIGYAEAFAVLDGECDEDAARAQTVKRTWSLARRQMTWLRHQIPVSWVDVAPGMTVEEQVACVRRQWEQDGPSTLYL